jgi:hypothetical protein
VLYVKSEGREAFRFLGEEVKQIPLPHEGERFAARGQAREIGNLGRMSIEDAARARTS